MVRKFFYQLQKFHMNIKKTILQWSCGNPWSWLKPSNFLSRSSLYIECLEAQKLGIKKFNRENVVELLINLGECFMLQSHVRNLIWEKRVYRKVDCCLKQMPSIAFISRPSYMDVNCHWSFLLGESLTHSIVLWLCCTVFTALDLVHEACANWCWWGFVTWDNTRIPYLSREPPSIICLPGIASSRIPHLRAIEHLAS